MQRTRYERACTYVRTERGAHSVRSIGLRIHGAGHRYEQHTEQLVGGARIASMKPVATRKTKHVTRNPEKKWTGSSYGNCLRSKLYMMLHLIPAKRNFGQFEGANNRYQLQHHIRFQHHFVLVEEKCFNYSDSRVPYNCTNS